MGGVGGGGGKKDAGPPWVSSPELETPRGIPLPPRESGPGAQSSNCSSRDLNQGKAEQNQHPNAAGFTPKLPRDGGQPRKPPSLARRRSKRLPAAQPAITKRGKLQGWDVSWASPKPK